MGRRAQQGKARLSAATADRLALYEASVQEPEADVRLIDRAFRGARRRRPLTLREDFCGTAWLCAEWARSHPERRAWGVDLHGPTLDWGRRRHLEPLGEAARRVQLLEADVLEARTPRVDVVAAFNFSYWIFRERAQMLHYFRRVRAALGPEGVFFLDLYGGPDAQCESEERTPKKGFTYVWEQGPMDAISGRARRWIHFEFRDGSRLERAFTYDWRIWSLPELRDLLADAGFARTDVYWEDADEDGEGTGVWRRRKRAENEQAWIAYLAAWRET